MRVTRRQAAFWIVLVLAEALVVTAGVRHLLSVRIHDGVIMYGPDVESLPRPCAPLPTLDVEDLTSQDTSCNLAGAVVVVRGSQLPRLPTTEPPSDERIKVPDQGGWTESTGTNGAAGVGIVHLSRGLGVVVYTQDHAWGLPEGIEVALEAGFLDDEILRPRRLPQLPALAP